MNKIEVHKDVIYNNRTTKDITIIHIGDIHFNKQTKDKNLNDVKETIIKNNPDYVVITGDLIDIPAVTRDRTVIKRLLVFLTDISNHAKVIISIGNHDIFKTDDLKFFKQLNELNNIFVLNNESYIDESIYISGFTLPYNYYYNIDKRESKEILIEHLKKHKKLINNLPVFIPKVSLIHSPMKLPDKEVLTLLKEYDLLLSGHTHGGMVPKILNNFFKPNEGIIAPNKRLFPEVARGKIEKNLFNKKITIIITSGITKLGEKSAKTLSKLNFIYNIDINKIIITNKRGIYYE